MIRARARGGASTGARSPELAVQEIYRAEYGRLAGWCNRLVGDEDLAHDFATEAFVRLLDKWGTVDEPRPWLYTCVGNLVKDHWRKRGRESRAYATYEASGMSEPGGPEVDRATTLSVRDAVESLPDRLRMPVLLFYFADLPVAAVARQLGMSEGAVKRYLYEARARLAPMVEGVR